MRWPSLIEYIVLKQITHPLSYLFLAPGSHVAAVCYQNNRGHSVCGGVRQAHRRLHGAVSEWSDSVAESRYDSLSTWPAAVKLTLTLHHHRPTLPLALSQRHSWPDCTKPSSSHAQTVSQRWDPTLTVSSLCLSLSIFSYCYIHSRGGHRIKQGMCYWAQIPIVMAAIFLFLPQTQLMSSYSDCYHKGNEASLASYLYLGINTNTHTHTNTTAHAANKRLSWVFVSVLFTLAQPIWIMKQRARSLVRHDILVSPSEEVMASVTLSRSSYPLPQSDTNCRIGKKKSHTYLDK